MEKKQSTDVAACPVNASHETTACVPVSIKPFANSGAVSLECCGCPVICVGGEKCGGVPNGFCEFTISQKMRVNIPITFGADIAVGETYVQCGRTDGLPDGAELLGEKESKELKDNKEPREYKDYREYNSAKPPRCI